MSSRNYRKMSALQREYSNSMWAFTMIEAALFLVFAESLKGDQNNFEAMQAAYFSVNSFEIRLCMIHAAAKVTFKSKSQLVIWNTIRNECDKQSSIRGKIAHLYGRLFEPEKTGQEHLAILTKALLHPSFPANYGMAKNEGYSAEKLKKFSENWQQLALHIANFAVYSTEYRQHKASSSRPFDRYLRQSHKVAQTPTKRG